ncbi:hypothetical protein MRX96_018373 [Rhipicephalus microplus]
MQSSRPAKEDCGHFGQGSHNSEGGFGFAERNTQESRDQQLEDGSPRKCQLIQDKVSFLGYVIFAEGRTLDESRVAAVEKFEPHRNAKKLYSFLQFANHYRKFIPEFAKVTHKLRHLLAKDVPFVWTDAHEATVNAIKHALKNPPILASFRPDCPTNVHVDASQTGLGAVLSQTQDGKERITEYASRSLNEHDRGLHSNMLECMALHWAITEKFSVYLRGGPRFTVFTDNFSLSYLVQEGSQQPQICEVGRST